MASRQRVALRHDVSPFEPPHPADMRGVEGALVGLSAEILDDRAGPSSNRTLTGRIEDFQRDNDSAPTASCGLAASPSG